MSYDLLVFDPEHVPADRAGFMEWYDSLDEEDGDEAPLESIGSAMSDPSAAEEILPDVHDPARCTSKLRAWYVDMLSKFPAMNGPDADYENDDPDEGTLTDYCFDKHSIYMTFSWSSAEEAYRTTLKTAEKHSIGFFDVSSESGAVWLPRPGGFYAIVHQEE